MWCDGVRREVKGKGGVYLLYRFLLPYRMHDNDMVLRGVAYYALR